MYPHSIFVWSAPNFLFIIIVTSCKSVNPMSGPAVMLNSIFLAFGRFFIKGLSIICSVASFTLSCPSPLPNAVMPSPEFPSIIFTSSKSRFTTPCFFIRFVINSTFFIKISSLFSNNLSKVVLKSASTNFLRGKTITVSETSSNFLISSFSPFELIDVATTTIVNIPIVFATSETMQAISLFFFSDISVKINTKLVFFNALCTFSLKSSEANIFVPTFSLSKFP